MPNTKGEASTKLELYCFILVELATQRQTFKGTLQHECYNVQKMNMVKLQKKKVGSDQLDSEHFLFSKRI